MTSNTPHKRGQYRFLSVIYSTEGLYYSDPTQKQYKVFEIPTPGFETNYIDTSAFASLPRLSNWPFDIYNTPINGLVRIPEGDGPFPLIIFAHGNHAPLDNSTPGYLYLCELLASNGFIAATIDVNFLNGANRGENDGRAIIHLEHVKQFKMWHQQSGHLLEGKVDLDNIMLVGHSRGGEAVGLASYFNKRDSVQPDSFSPIIPLDGRNGLGPYFFNLKAIAAIAPTDGQYVPVSGAVKIEDNYFLIHGSRDNDVWTFPGQKIYDRAENSAAVNSKENQQGFKSLLWVFGANHNYFNSGWQQESSDTITRNEQELILSIYISALANLTLKEPTSSQNILMNHKLVYQNHWLPSTQKLVSQYYDYASFSIQNNENDSTLPILNDNITGNVETIGIDYKLLELNLGPRRHLYQQTRAMRIDWLQRDSSYIINLDPEAMLSEDYTHLSFRVGQSFETNNAAGINQDFNIELSDGEKSTTIKASDVSDLIFPDSTNEQRGREPKTVMQSFIIPLKESGADKSGLDEISQIKFNFNIREQGTLYMDDLVLISKGENTHADD